MRQNGASRLPADAAEAAQRGPLYVSAKRTHRFWRKNLVEHPYVTILMTFAEEIFRWVRFPKRTHREGVLRGFWEQIRGNSVKNLLLQSTRRSAPRCDCLSARDSVQHCGSTGEATAGQY